MKDYKSFIGEAAGEGFGKDAAYNQAVKREGSKLLKKEQEANRKEEESKQQTTRRKPIGYAFSPEKQNTSTATSRKARRAEVRQNKIDKIKYDRGQKLKQGVQAASRIRDRVVGKGSGTIGTTGGGNSSDPSVRYQ